VRSIGSNVPIIIVHIEKFTSVSCSKIGRGSKPTRKATNIAEIPPAARPFRALDRSALILRLERAFAAGEGAAVAHGIHELWMRNEPPMSIEALLARAWAVAASTVPDWLPMRHVAWLPTVYEVASRFKPRGRGRSNIYLVLLDYGDRGGEPHGVYVGATRYSPSERFDQHKAGIRSAGSVLKRGIEVLTGPVLHLQRIKRVEAGIVEEGLAEALRAEGLLVRGGH
jgi:hypothetical protein